MTGPCISGSAIQRLEIFARAGINLFCAETALSMRIAGNGVGVDGAVRAAGCLLSYDGLERWRLMV